MKRDVGNVTKPGKSPPAPDTVFAKKYPKISEFMSDGWWEDGKPRELSSIAINFNGGVVNIGLSDHAQARTAYSTAESIEEALGLLEASLVSGRPVWRSWKAGKGK